MERTRAALAALACALTLLLGLVLGRTSPPPPGWHAAASVRSAAAHHAPVVARAAVRPGTRVVVADRERRIAKDRRADPCPCDDALLAAGAPPTAIVTSTRAPAPDLRAASPRLPPFARWAEARAPPRCA